MQSPEQLPTVDLVIVIDTNFSMKDAALELSAAAEAATEAARAHCPSDLRLVWLGVEGTWLDTRFDRSVRRYLTETCGVAEASLRGRQRDDLPGGGAQEDGARVMEDIADHFDWRADARRAMFYLSDSALNAGGSLVESEDIEAANVAIEIAQRTGLMVHTYFGATQSHEKAALEAEFARVSGATGGQAFTHEERGDGFAEMLESVICASRPQVMGTSAASASVTTTAADTTAAAATTTPASTTASTTTPSAASAVTTTAATAPPAAAATTPTPPPRHLPRRLRPHPQHQPLRRPVVKHRVPNLSEGWCPRKRR
ncbi:hypothetical protein [Candidatus Entotheonella palauensis]|uniref:VWFA domain-containing protein n=1 Tax=Candidatus Entotheonella gemina TaxID=1429439 RepID=W4MD02_9BACT|nr:hypothetical protein [Candidatus Entotheonella palauensis]ETX07781.1 MAG: hypothetical protein ETSY2_09220 [Candidatus Entotheonella gemina]